MENQPPQGQQLQIAVMYPQGLNPQFVAELEHSLPSWVSFKRQETITRAVLPPFPTTEVIIQFATVTIAAGALEKLGESLALACKDKIKSLIFRRKRNKNFTRTLESAYFRITIEKENLLLFGDCGIEDFKTAVDALASLATVVSSAQRKRRAALKGTPQSIDFRKVRYYEDDGGPEGLGTYFYYEYKAPSKRWVLQKIEVYEPIFFDQTRLNADGSLKRS